MARLWRVGVTGRNQGAIGIFYALPSIEVEASTVEEAQEKARQVYYGKGYEHLAISFVREVQRG